VFLAPVLPGITDQIDELEQLVRAVAERGARNVWSSTLRLAPGVKEHFFDVVRAHFPALANDYERFFAFSANAPAGYQIKLEARVDALRQPAGLPAQDPEPRSDQMARRGQLALPI
jgi:DNA repair photolyase